MPNAASKDKVAKRSNEGRRKHTDDTIYQWVADAIFEQRLPSGTKLPEDSLGDIFSVSRTVVRKALYRLASEKLVEMRPNRGAAVASLSVEEARQVFQTRRIIEAATMALAMEHMADADLERLGRIVADDEAASEHDDDRRRRIRHSGNFHLEIARIAGNEVLAGFLKELIGRTSLIIGLYETTDGLSCSCREHSELLDCVRTGDADAAVATMTEHLLACERRLGLEEQAQPVDLWRIFADAGSAPSKK